jgi:WD40 repeat protein/uncharacterized caspase-like protein
MPSRYLLLSVAFLAASQPAVAQQLDRRSRDEPDIAVESGGRVGTCDALRFSPDGRSLLAAGDDKVVRVWAYSPGEGLDTRSDHMQTLRWPAWREQRGQIKAMAVYPDGKRVAIGGLGLIPSMVAVLDRATGEPVGLSWPRSRQGESFGSVTAIAFHPDGRRVGFATRDGNLWLWDPVAPDKPDEEGRMSKAPARAGRHTGTKFEPGAPIVFNYPRLIYFPDPNTLVSVAENGDVVACDLRGPLTDEPWDAPQAGVLFNVNANVEAAYKVFRAERTPDGKWLVIACVGPQVIVRSNDGKMRVLIPLPDDSFPRSIAFHPQTRQLAVGVGSAFPKNGKPRFIADREVDRVLIFDDPTAGGEPKPKLTIKLAGPAEALAFHPTDERLAIAGGDADEVTLYDLKEPENPKSVARGAGRRLWGVKLSANGKLLGIQPARDLASCDPNARGKADGWAIFDLPRRRVSKDTSQEWVGPLTEADGWSVLPSGRDPYVWTAVLKREGEPAVEREMAFDPARDQMPMCYTFLPAKNGGPTRLLVGHGSGVSLFTLTPEAAVRVKLFTGHAGHVQSVVAAKDLKWFVTAAADHTVAAWSLTDAVLGAAAEVQNGRVVVTAVDTGAPAWEAGLRVGDTLDLLAVRSRLVFDRRPGKKPVGTPEDVLVALQRPTPGVELYFGLQPKDGGPRRETLTSVRGRPLWKMYPTFGDDGRLDDWVMWMWQGSFYDTSTHGDRLVGWHVNHPEIVKGKPEFHPLERFKDQFFRRGVIDKVVTGLSVADALADDTALGANPQPRPFRLLEPAPVRLTVDKSEVGPNGVQLTVDVSPRGSNPDLLPHRVELWLNDYRFEVWPGDGKNSVKKTVTVPANKFRAGENRVAVLSFNPAGGRAEYQAAITDPRPAGQPTLLGLAVGVNDYGDHRVAFARRGGRGEEFRNLLFPKDDADGLVKRLEDYRGPGKCYPQASTLLLRVDKDANRKTLTADLDRLAASAKPNDLLVVFFAGHGCDPDTTDAPAGGRALRAGVGRFVFCCPDFDPGNVPATALSAEELFDRLAKVNCRKLVLLDACHSGGAAEANLIRRLVPDGQGPVVIAACTQRQLSLEHPKFKHGLFTYAVLQALGPEFNRADRDNDGVITPAELFRYVEGRIPRLVEEAFPPGKDGAEPPSQNPVCFPRELKNLKEFVVVKK